MIIPLWLLGCLISLSGSIGAVCGTAIQKISFRRNEALPLSSRRVYYKQTRWLAGLCLVFVGGLTDFVSLGMAPQSTIAALGSVSLAANVPLAYFWLGESIAWRDGAGTAMIVIGSTVSVVFGDHSDTSYSTAQLKELYTHTPYILYGSIIVTCMIIMYLTCRFKLTPLRVRLVESIDRYNTLQLECNMAIAAEQAEREEQAAYRRNLSNIDLASAIPAGSTPKVSSPPIITNIVVAPASAIDQPLLANGTSASDDATTVSEMKSPVTDSNPIRDTGDDNSAPNGIHKQPLLAASAAAGSSSSNSLSSLAALDDHSSNTNPSILTSLQYTAPLADARAEMVALELAYTPYSNVHSVFYCAISGVFGAQSLLFGKSVAELIADSMKKDGENQFLDPCSYAFMAALGFCLLGQLHFFASGLQLFDALFVVPVFKCFFLTLSTIGGGLFFQEFECFGLTQAVLSPIGLLLNLVGVYVLSSRTMGVPPVRKSSIIADEEDDELMAGSEYENEPEPIVATVLDFGNHEDNAALKEDLLHRRRSRVVSCESMDLDEEEAHARAIAEASENLLRSAVEIAQEEAAAQAHATSPTSASSRRISRVKSEPGISDISPHSGGSSYLQPPANDQVLLVTNMDGIVLVASPIVNHATSVLASPEAVSIFEQRQREASILHSPTPITRAPTVVLTAAAEEHAVDAQRRISSVISPDMRRQGSSASLASMASVASEPIMSHYGSTDFANAAHHPSAGNMSIVVSDENAPTAINSRRSSATAVSHPEAPLYPSLMTPHSGRGSSLSMGGGGFLTPMGTHVNMFSIPASLPQTGGILRSSTTAPTRDQFASMLGSATPASYSAAGKFSNLKRAASEQSPLDPLDTHPASLNNVGARGSISTLRASATFSRPPRSGRGSVPPQPQRVVRKPSDVLVQRGSVIYRTAGTALGGSTTPLDAALSDSIGVAHATSGGAGGRMSTECPGSALDSVPVFLTPGASSSFTVQSPLTHAEYSIPRRDSIFAHTRSYLRRLSQAALGVSGGGAGVPGILAQPHRTSIVSPTNEATAIKGYTAPSPRMTDAERALLASHANDKPHAFSDGIGPTTYLEQQFAAAHTFTNQNSHQPSSIAQHHAAMEPSSLSQQDWGLSGHSDLITPANTYVPPQFLIQPLAQPQKQHDAE